MSKHRSVLWSNGSVSVSVRISELLKMETLSLSFFCLLLLDFQPGHGALAPASGPVFLSGPAADGVLRRHKRFNDWFEEIHEGDLERECVEEVCNLEEAREIFENDELTMEFWAGYIDGNQCQTNPCLNQGTCTDHLGYYTCSCAAGFTGRNCGIVIAKRCDVNNGGCMHFCESMATFGAKCLCARGYRLMEDGENCEPAVEFPCGRTALTSFSAASSRSLLRSVNSSLTSNTSTTSPPSTPPTPPTPTNTTTSPPATNDSVVNRSIKKLPLWVYEEASLRKPSPHVRIVGGKVVFPGEIPWQVGLIARPSGQLFCGGSILSERWVITAAHCLVESQGSFFLRMGDHNIYLKEDTEQDHEVLEQHLHPRYNATLSLYNHDIALLYLKSPIKFTTTVRPICIGPKAFIEALTKDSSPGTVSGWGRTRFMGLTADSLQKVEVPFKDQTECKRTSSTRVTPVMFCAGYYDEEKDACQGDSGGPHANKIHDTWFLTGIVSWGEECAKEGKYGVYTRLSLYYRWLNHVMGLTKHRLVSDMEEPDPEI